MVVFGSRLQLRGREAQRETARPPLSHLPLLPSAKWQPGEAWGEGSTAFPAAPSMGSSHPGAAASPLSPALRLCPRWREGKFQEVIETEFVLLEVHGLFTYTYSLTAQTALCKAQPQNWTTIMETASDRGPFAWDREVASTPFPRQAPAAGCGPEVRPRGLVGQGCASGGSGHGGGVARRRNERTVLRQEELPRGPPRAR